MSKNTDIVIPETNTSNARLVVQWSSKTLMIAGSILMLPGGGLYTVLGTGVIVALTFIWAIPKFFDKKRGNGLDEGTRSIKAKALMEALYNAGIEVTKDEAVMFVNLRNSKIPYRKIVRNQDGMECEITIEDGNFQVKMLPDAHLEAWKQTMETCVQAYGLDELQKSARRKTVEARKKQQCIDRRFQEKYFNPKYTKG